MTRRAFIALLFGILLELFGFKPKREEKPSNFYKFNMGKTALKIRPDETFTATIHWPVTSLTIGDAPRVDPPDGFYEIPIEDIVKGLRDRPTPKGPIRRVLS